MAPQGDSRQLPERDGSSASKTSAPSATMNARPETLGRTLPSGSAAYRASKTLPIADFMSKTGTLKSKASSWKDLYFPQLHNLPGS